MLRFGGSLCLKRFTDFDHAPSRPPVLAEREAYREAARVDMILRGSSPPHLHLYPLERWCQAAERLMIDSRVDCLLRYSIKRLIG